MNESLILGLLFLNALVTLALFLSVRRAISALVLSRTAPLPSAELADSQSTAVQMLVAPDELPASIVSRHEIDSHERLLVVRPGCRSCEALMQSTPSGSALYVLEEEPAEGWLDSPFVVEPRLVSEIISSGAPLPIELLIKERSSV